MNDHLDKPIRYIKGIGEKRGEQFLEKGIKTLAGDIPSMGPWQVIRDTHLAGLGNGAIYVEQLQNLGKLPPVGAYFIFIPIKCKGASGGPGGALAIIP